MGLYPNEVRYVAYTGKAANVLRNKGCMGAMTAHKLIYHAKLLPNGKYAFTAKRTYEMEREIKVVVVDEVSMLPKRMWDLLCQYNFYILACGDPEQLPPVPDGKEDPNNHVLDNPHIFLDEIMRQAQESEIIRLSMHVREGKPLSTFPCKNEQVMIFNRRDFDSSMLLWADQVLCATNRNKVMLNQQMRQACGFPPDIQVGDKLINVHNEWEICSNLENPLTNGVIGKITELELQQWDYPHFIRREPLSIPILVATITGDEEGEEFKFLPFDYNEILTGQPSLTGKEEYTIMKRLDTAIPLHANFGYAITVWKAQGSEWNKILLFQESGWPRQEDERRKYMYTGVTRAVEKLVVII